MSQLTGNEFSGQKGSQGLLLNWLWARIFPAVNAVLPNTAQSISTALTNYYTKTETDGRINTAVNTAVSAESTARATAISTAVAAETTARTTAITAEASARTTAINNLKSYVDTNFDTGSAVNTKITNAINALKAGAPTALDTLKEIADKLTAMEGTDSTVSTQLAALIATVGEKASTASVNALTTTVNSLSTTVTNHNTSQQTKDQALMLLVKRAFYFLPRLYVRGLNTLVDKKLNTHAYRLTPGDRFSMNYFLAHHMGILLNRVHFMTLTTSQTWAGISYASKADCDYIVDNDKGIVVFNPDLFSEADLATIQVNYQISPKEVADLDIDTEIGTFITSTQATINAA